MTVSVAAIPAFKDNYIWAINNSNANTIALVDPGQAKPCLAYLSHHNVVLSAILVTHHHADHIGAIEELTAFEEKRGNKVKVFGPALETIPCCTKKLTENDTVSLDDLSLTFNIIDLPGHTLGHIAYVNNDMLFCGDTLFSGGCGRIFEGSPEQMFNSLKKLSRLPNNTKVYCAHEYTQANLNFALTVEPDNFDLINYFNQVTQLRANNQSTIPTNIALENKINPFLRSTSPTIIESANTYKNQKFSSELATFTAIREWKNNG